MGRAAAQSRNLPGSFAPIAKSFCHSETDPIAAAADGSAYSQNQLIVVHWFRNEVLAWKAGGR